MLEEKHIKLINTTYNKLIYHLLLKTTIFSTMLYIKYSLAIGFKPSIKTSGLNHYKPSILGVPIIFWETSWFASRSNILFAPRLLPVAPNNPLNPDKLKLCVL